MVSSKRIKLGFQCLGRHEAHGEGQGSWRDRVEPENSYAALTCQCWTEELVLPDLERPDVTLFSNALARCLPIGAMQDAQAERSSCWKLLLPEHRLHIPAHWLSEQLVAVTCQKLDELSRNTRRWACLEVFVLD